MKKLFIFLGFCLIGCSLVFAEKIQGGSAMKARDIAAKAMPPDCKDKVVAIKGLRSTVSVQPVEWYVWFYDSTAQQEGKRVKVSGGGVTEIKEGYTEIGKFRLAAYKPEEIIDPSKFKIDSDEALSRIKAAAALKNIKITAADFDLRKAEGDVGPLWRVVLYTEKKGSTSEVGFARISGETGQILELKVNVQ